MAAQRRLSPLEAFEDNMADAHYLVLLAEGLTNSRGRRARRELRERVGIAWKVPVRDRAQLDCLESPDVWLTFKPGSRLSRENFVDHRPLLRQALVAACAATETYLADRVMTQMGELTKSHDAASSKLRMLNLSVGDWLYIEQHYTHRRRGLRERVLDKRIRELASTSPRQIGELLTLIGVESWTKQLDSHRGCGKGETEAALERITQRRNKIVHTGDRQGRSRAPLTVAQAKDDLDVLESVVAAVEKTLDGEAP